MAKHLGPVLVDTNVILECWRIGGWKALTSGYGVETVEYCVIETQTGYQGRSPEQQIDEAALTATLKAIHKVSPLESASAVLREPSHAMLDLGEKDLWAHALARPDAWVLCGPDKASLNFGLKVGMRDRMIALETLLTAIGYDPKALKKAYSAKWLEITLGQLAVMKSGRLT
jgi:hypothetical protein